MLRDSGEELKEEVGKFFFSLMDWLVGWFWLTYTHLSVLFFVVFVFINEACTSVWCDRKAWREGKGKKKAFPFYENLLNRGFFFLNFTFLVRISSPELFVFVC